MGAPGLDLVADCGSCFGLCCVALPFTRSADFAFSKAGGEPCHNLRKDFGCGVHSSLRDLGMPGCTVFDCFGAGQAVSQKMYAGKDWRAPAESAPGGADSERASEMFEVFGSVRRLHEMLFYLTSALDHLCSIDEPDASHDVFADDVSDLRDRLGSLRDETQALASGTAYDVLGVDVDAHRLEVAPLLREASATIRSATTSGSDQERVGGSDLAGRNLSGLDLRSADLRGSLLIGANLAGSDLRWADLLGADLRACDVRGADLTSALFLTQMQVNAAHGDAETSISAALTRPSHWT